MMLSTSLTLAQRRPKDTVLDKKTFVVSMELQEEKKRNQEEPFEEELSFRSNKLTSKVMRMSDEGGFQMGEYAIGKREVVMDEVIFHFEAINKNSKGLSLKWEGKVFGNQIEGKAIVSKNGKVKEEYVFTGSLKIK
jgi:hypothetical protein